MNTSYIYVLAATAMKRFLAQSEKFKVVSEYEYVDLIFNHNSLSKGDRTVYIGDFYGDPTCALISRDEEYLVVGGNGFLIYSLNEPFTSYNPDSNQKQYMELFREPENTWWVDAVYQSTLDQNTEFFRAVVNKENGVSVFKINAKTGEYSKILCG